MAGARSQSTARNDPAARRGLGRGLAALMPGSQPAGSPTAPSSGFRVLPIERIHPCRTQPRKVFHPEALADLAASIKVQGVLQPVIVRRMGEGFELVAGERRWRAAQQAGLRDIPAVIKELTDAAALQVALIENVQRQDLDPLEEAESYSRLIRDHELTHEQVAEAVSKSRSAITNSLRLLKLPAAVQAMLADGRLTAGHARALMTLESPREVVRLAEDFVGRRTSVRDAEIKVRQVSAGKATRPSAPAAKNTPAQAALEERLRLALGTKVKLHEERGSGRIEIHFHSLDALDGLLDRLCPA